MLLQCFARFSANNLFSAFALILLNKIDFKGLSGCLGTMWEAPWLNLGQSPPFNFNIYTENQSCLFGSPYGSWTVSTLDITFSLILSQSRMASQMEGVWRSDSFGLTMDRKLLLQLRLFSPQSGFFLYKWVWKLWCNSPCLSRSPNPVPVQQKYFPVFQAVLSSELTVKEIFGLRSVVFQRKNVLTGT